MSELAIATDGLTKRYKNLIAVNALDLEIAKGTVFGFLGPNGAGKTTTIRMLLGLISPSAGVASVLGYNVADSRMEISKRVGAIVETPTFYTYLTGEENLRVLTNSSNLKVDQPRLTAIVERVGLKGREKDRVRSYSLGMKQRLGIAAILLADPEILFLDEPTNGLDPAGTVEIRNLISQLGQEGHTIFLSSHLLNEVEQVCSDVAIIQSGVKRLQGKISQLLSQNCLYAIKATPPDKALHLLQENASLNAIKEDEEWIVIKVEAKDVPQIVKRLVLENIDIYQVEERRNTLEKLFLELTEKDS